VQKHSESYVTLYPLRSSGRTFVSTGLGASSLGEERIPMRRTITVIAASAFVLGGVAVAAPAANAAKVLKPGAVTAIKVSPTTKGTATFTWKAPVAKAGKTAKASSYVVACPGQKKVTVKTTKAVAPVTASQVKNLVCTVTAYAGKVAGPAAKSPKFSAYHAWGTTSITLAPAAATALAGLIDVSAPGTIVANDDGSATLRFPITSSADASDQANAWTHAGGLVINGTTDAGDVTIPIGGLTIAQDVNSTFDVPLFDIYGTVNGQQIPLLLLSSPEPNQNNANELDFNVSLTTNADVIALLGTVGLPFPAGTPLGTGSSVWN
jgi:hypothetical protein